jgi:hypothetical protein
VHVPLIPTIVTLTLKLSELQDSQMGARGRTTVSAGMLTLIGEAVAVGDNTLITGSIAATSRDLGPVTKASGITTFTSTAQATDGGTPMRPRRPMLMQRAQTS